MLVVVVIGGGGGKMKLIKIRDETHKKLTRLKGVLTVRTSESQTYDDAITELLDFYEEKAGGE